MIDALDVEVLVQLPLEAYHIAFLGATTCEDT